MRSTFLGRHVDIDSEYEVQVLKMYASSQEVE